MFHQIGEYSFKIFVGNEPVVSIDFTGLKEYAELK
jgi:hypothetical protein